MVTIRGTCYGGHAFLSFFRRQKRRSVPRPAPRSRRRPRTPVELEIQFKHYRPAEILAFLPNVERIEAHAVRFVAKDILEAARFLSFVTNYEPGPEP